MDDRERNRQGLTNFLDALQSVLISIQNLHEIDNDREVELEQVRDRLQDAQITLQVIAQPLCPGPFGIEAVQEKALVKSGHVTPQILDIFVTWPCNCYAITGG